MCWVEGRKCVLGAGQRPFLGRCGGPFCKWRVETILSWRRVFHFKEAKTSETILRVCVGGGPSLYTGDTFLRAGEFPYRREGSSFFLVKGQGLL